MKIKVLVGILLALTIINTAAFCSLFYLHLHGQKPRAPSERGRRWVMKNVPAKDRARFFRTVRGIREDIGPLADSTAVLEKQLINSMRKDPAPRAHIDSLLEQISHNRLEIARRATNRVIDMGDSLTPDERERMVDAILRLRNADRANRWRKRRQPEQPHGR